MKNAVIWGFDTESIYPAILSLKDKGLINIVAWIGETIKCPYCTHDQKIDFFTGYLNKDQYRGVNQSIYKEMLDLLYQFIDMYSRQFRRHEKPVHEYVNLFNMLIDYFYNLFVTKKVDLVLIYNIHHSGPDFIIYMLAKKMEIKTITFQQTLFPNKFFYMFDVDDFAEIKDIQPQNEGSAQFKIDKKYEKELFYMKKKKKSNTVTWRNSNYWREKYGRLIHKFKIKRDSIDLLYYLAENYLRYKRRKKYQKNLATLCCSKVDLDAKFVYFPLHLQPEMTTSALGGMFVDQLLAIEKLSEILPEDWFIYVKENPKQTEFMRGPWFFDRLKLIKNVKLVSPSFDTYLLLKNSVFVSTITGTVGWEAISGGKNVLIFGKAWYKSLPGVFTFDDSFKLETILNYKIDHQELEKKLGLLLSKTGNGVVEPKYSVQVKDYNPETNARSIASLLEKII